MHLAFTVRQPRAEPQEDLRESLVPLAGRKAVKVGLSTRGTPTQPTRERRGAGPETTSHLTLTFWTPGLWTLEPRPWTLDPRPSTLDPGPWTLDPGPSTLDPGPFDPGPSTLGLRTRWSGSDRNDARSAPEIQTLDSTMPPPPPPPPPPRPPRPPPPPPPRPRQARSADDDHIDMPAARAANARAARGPRAEGPKPIRASQPPLTFPALRTVLWDRRPIAGPVHVQPQHAVPLLRVRRSALALLHTHLVTPHSKPSLLMGVALRHDAGAFPEDEEDCIGGGWVASLSSFDAGSEIPGNERLARPSMRSASIMGTGRAVQVAVLGGDCAVGESNGADDPSSTAVARDVLDRHVVRSRFRTDDIFRFYARCRGQHGHRLQFEAVVPWVDLAFTRIPDLPVLSTPLSRFLLMGQRGKNTRAEPHAHRKGAAALPTTGFLTLNHGSARSTPLGG